MNQMVEAQVATLESLLAQTLAVDDHVDFQTLKDSTDIPEFDPGPLGVPAPTPIYESPRLELPAPPSFFGRLLPGWKKRHAERTTAVTASHAEAVKAAEVAHADALEAHKRSERERNEKLAAARAEHEEASRQLRVEVEAQHRRIDQFQEEFEAGKPEVVCAYFDLVLQRSSYPEGFPKTTRLAFVPESKQLVVEYELPPFEIVPAVASYKYMKTRNSISESPRPLTQRKQLYASVVAQVTIRTLHELFEADRSHLLDTIVFNGMVTAIDKGTGKEIRPCLVTVRTTRSSF